MTLKIGGISKLLRKTENYEAWKRAVFIRDRFTCQNCGRRNGRKLVIEAHHLTEFSDLIKSNNITSVEEGINNPLLWDMNNGQTLCHDCHTLTDSYPKSLVGVTPKKNMSGWYSIKKPSESL